MWWLIGIAIVVYLVGSSAQSGADTSSWSSIMGGVMAKFENANPNYNNPMAVQGTGDTGTTAGNGLGIFSTMDAGMQAGINLLESYASRFPNLTITQALARWGFGTTDVSSLSDESIDKVTNEASMVGDALNVDPDQTTLGDLSD